MGFPLPATADLEGSIVNWVCSSYLVDVETEAQEDGFLVSGLIVRPKATARSEENEFLVQPTMHVIIRAY